MVKRVRAAWWKAEYKDGNGNRNTAYVRAVTSSIAERKLRRARKVKALFSIHMAPACRGTAIG